MELLLLVLLGWALLSVLGVLGAAAVCRSGHAEDVARGFVDLTAEGLAASPADRVPAPRSAVRDEVTRR